MSHTLNPLPATRPRTGKSVAEIHIQTAYWTKRFATDAAPTALGARPLIAALAVPRSGWTWRMAPRAVVARPWRQMNMVLARRKTGSGAIAAFAWRLDVAVRTELCLPGWPLQ